MDAAGIISDVDNLLSILVYVITINGITINIVIHLAKSEECEFMYLFLIVSQSKSSREAIMVSILPSAITILYSVRTEINKEVGCDSWGDKKRATNHGNPYNLKTKVETFNSQ